MLDRPIRPCVFPGCRDVEGNPEQTRDVICERSRYHYRRLLERLGWDYVTLRVTLPKPVATSVKQQQRTGGARTFGHPAEWSSDKLAEIASSLNNIEDDLRDHLGHDPAVHPGHAEPRRVALALDYLRAWFDELCVYPGAEDAAIELRDLHGGIRAGLGRTSRSVHLPTPCPSCGLLTLFRSLSSDDAGVDCRNCGAAIPFDEYGSHTRDLVDDALGRYGRDASCA